MASDRCFVELSPATSGMPFLVIPGAPQYARERVVAQIVRDVCTESELAMPVRWTLGEQRLRQDRESQVRPVQGTRTAFDADAPTCSQLRVAASSVSAAISHCYVDQQRTFVDTSPRGPLECEIVSVVASVEALVRRRL